MEPVDPGKNVEGNGCSKRRISSILKAPRKSLLLRDSEQQENEVETAKPVEKRNSRRVSFAPANDVLLFAKDAKNASPARNPLQELMGAATATTQNRVQMMTAEDTSPQIIGIETLLNAPLHASQQRIMVHFDSGSGVGENTVVFSTEDADMDVTHSHTININSDADLLADPEHQNSNLLLPGGGTGADVFTEVPPSHFVQATNQASALPLNKKADSSVETRSISTAAPLLDPGFKDFLSSLSSSGMTPLTSDDIKSSLGPDVDKENQMPKSLSSSRNIGESLNGSAFRTDDDVSMDVTEAQTGCILGPDDDDPFQCLFPTQEMYEKSERKSQTRETKQQQSCESLESNDQKANKSLINLSVLTPLESHKIYSGLKNDFREKTVVFPADEFMDITQNLKGSIAGADRSHKIPTHDQENQPNPAAPAKPGGDFSMDLTEGQATLGSDDVFQFLIPSQEMQPLCKSQKKKIFKLGQQNIDGPQSADHQGLKSSSKLNMETQRHQLMDKIAAPDDHREKPLRLSAGEDSLDVTQSRTVHISTNIKPLQNANMAPSCEEKSIRFYADDATMDMTQCLTTNIATDLDKFSSLHSLSSPNDADSTTMAATSGPPDGFTVYLDDNMDMTEAQTGRILEAEVREEMLHKHESLQTEATQHQSIHGKTERNLHQQDDEGFGASDYTETSTKTSLKTIIQRNQIEFEPKDDCREKTVRFDAADVCMDATRCNTLAVDISSDLPLPYMVLAANGEKTVRFSANDAEMDVTKSHTVNILRDLPLQSFTNVALPENGEKTVRFNANDAAMDVTRSHTVDIVHHLNVLVDKKEDFLPAEGERTQRFGASDAEMDVTKSHTVNIMRDLPLQSFTKVALPANGEKMLRFGANDAEMDVTKSHTVNILRDFPNVAIPSNGEKMLRFSANEAAMDVTRSHTVSIEHDLDQLPRQNVGALPADGERTERFGVNDAEMEVTKSLTGKFLGNSNVLSDQIVNPPPAKEENLAWMSGNDVTMNITRSHTVSIVTDFDQITDSSPTDTERTSNTFVDETGSDTKSISKNYKLALHHNESGEKTSKFTTNDATMDMTHCLTVNIVRYPQLHPVMSDQNSENMNDTLAMKETDDGNCGLDSNPSSSTQSDPFQTSCAQGEANGNAPSCPDSSYSRRKTKEPDTDPENESSSLGSDVGKPINKTKTNTEDICASVDQTEPLASSADDPPQGASSNPHSKSFMESVPDEHRPEAERQAVSQKMESSPINADQNTDVLSSRMSRRKSLADLQSKVKRLSQLINAAPDPAAVETCTASLLHLDPNLEKNTNDGEAEPLPVATSTTPFSLKTKQLMSRLSVGGFKPKLPKRNTMSAVKEPTKTFTVSVPNQLSRFDKITDIHDEELVDCEDFSETIDTMSPEKLFKKDNLSDQFSTFQPLEEDFAYVDDFMSSSQSQKRSLPENEDETEEDGKRKKMCAEFTETASQSDDDYESSMAAARTQTIDSSSNTTNRCEIASESTFKHSLFESQLEDYGSDGQKKLEDGTITVLEFFNLFSIDFVIHNPRQSVLPGRLLDNSDATALDLLKDKHISRPKQTVYETDVKSLTEKVEGLKYRMQDLGKPLKTVNRSLWEEVNHFTEKELKAFGAKLKERNNFFRKNSKVQSHEMKEQLYANLVRVNLEEQQKLRGTISQADEMIQTLDGCISELEAELDAVLEKGSEDKLSLKSLQEEMSKVTETLADHERQTSELDLEKKKNSSELLKLKAEERKLENYMDALNMLNEWRLEEKDDKKDNCSVFTFLHKTLFLRLVYEKTNGDSRSERKMTNISFNFHLNDEKSQCHARLVHKLVSQFIEGESGWVEKYPTRGHVPKLLHDVSLVVSRCRLVGEELRLLKMWGNLRFDILHISCSQTQVHVVFSSLKKLSKFEVVFGVRLTDQTCVFHVQSFKNLIGNTTIQQIEDVVASLSPGRNLFTRIIKKIHETLLS